MQRPGIHGKCAAVACLLHTLTAPHGSHALNGVLPYLYPTHNPPTHVPRTSGVSNTVTALAGVGLTGSYLFSQTLLSRRLGVDSPLMGAIIAGVALF